MEKPSMRHQINQSLQFLVMVGRLPITKGDTGIYLNDYSKFEWSINDLTDCEMIEKVISEETGKTGYRPTEKGKAIYESLLCVLSPHITNWGPVPDDWP